MAPTQRRGLLPGGPVPSDTDPLVTDVRGAAKALCIGITKTRELIKSGELPSVHIGTRVLVPLAGIEQLVARLAEREAA